MFIQTLYFSNVLMYNIALKHIEGHSTYVINNNKNIEAFYSFLIICDNNLWKN